MSAQGQRQVTAEPKRNEVLTYLKEIFPTGAPTHDLVERFGWCIRTRIVELRADGWLIENEFDDANNEAVYRLTSLEKDEPAPEIVEACKILIFSNRTAEVIPYAQGHYSEDLAKSFEFEAVGRLVSRFDVDVNAVDFVTEKRGRAIVISLADRVDPQQDWFQWCMDHLDGT